jgi:hypothetical protein
MRDQHRDFLLYGSSASLSDTLLGRITKWYPTGSIDYKRRSNAVVELTRIQLRSMTFDDQETAEIFGLELARLLVDTSYREFAMVRYETEKKLVRQERSRR